MYKVISKQTIRSLEEEVNDLIKKGWIPLGGVAIEIEDHDVRSSSSGSLWNLKPVNKYCQAMINEERTEF